MSSSTTKSQPTGELHILFIRHGETQDNIDRILQGQRDTLLTEKGHREAQAIAEKLHNQHIDIIYHSPLKRMIQTIQPLTTARPNIPTVSDADLMGQFLGSLEGQSYSQVDLNDPRSADGNPSVEPFDNFVHRLKRSLARIIGVEAPQTPIPTTTTTTNSPQNRTVLIATHGVAITSLFRALSAIPPYDNFNARVAEMGPDAHEVRSTDSDDVSRLVVRRPGELPVGEGGVLLWEGIEGVSVPFLVEYWGKKGGIVRA